MTNSSKNPSASGKKPAKSTAPKAATGKPEEKKPAATAKAAPKRPAAVQSSPAKPAAKADAKPAAKPAAKRAPKASAKAPATRTTTVAVEADVGFGNQLFIRGDAPGLNWNHGVPMTCKDSSHWEWTAQGATQPFLFKVLINDQLWSHGEDWEVQPGERRVVQPEF